MPNYIGRMISQREFQEINYPILWGGQHERPVDMALVSPTPQELIEYFFIWKSQNKLFPSIAKAPLY